MGKARELKEEKLKKSKILTIKQEVNMPGFDKTGPMGQGSLTGRRMGKCTNFGAGKSQQAANTVENSTEKKNNDVENIEYGLGRGRGRRCWGRGNGMGRMNRFRGGDGNQ